MLETAHVFIEAWKTMVGRLPAASLQHSDGVATCYGHVPLLFFNLWIADRPVSTPEELGAILQTAAGRASAHPTGGVLREDWLPAGWEEVLKESGLAPMMKLTGMETDQLLAPRRPLADLEIKRVADDATARDLATLNAHAYGMPTELFECIANMRLWHADSYGFVGYAEGQPVSTASVFPVEGTVYVALVATSPNSQGKGYAETVMRHAVTQGQRAMGITRTTLHASDMGQPVYRAMGYTPGPQLIVVGPPHST